MMRVMGIITAATVVSQLAATSALAVPTSEPPRQHPPRTMPNGNSIEPTGTKVTFHSGRVHDLRRKKPVAAHLAPPVTRPTEHPDVVATSDPALPELPPGLLTIQEQDVGDIAVEHGDRRFLMVDKTLGKILLWEDGKPVFIGNALTGASYADRLPPNEMNEAFANLNALDTKVTPAGRFTVTRGYEKGYGPLFDIREIQGKDWAIAIHKVFLGFPWENRAARLQSSRYDDKNITFGCINVTPDTMRLLLRELPEAAATPLYVLPRDEPKTAAYFAPPGSWHTALSSSRAGRNSLAGE
jgi:hypothetical protein